MKLTPARVSSILAGVGVLITGLAPAVANFDATSTAGAVGSTLAIVVLLDRFLVGQRAHEERTFNAAYDNSTYDKEQVDVNPQPV